jgi:Lrp/AsnC family leucine-responsive transcriptional regulator
MKELLDLGTIDKKILTHLQNDERITYAELARRVGLSTSPCLERVKRMERLGIIKGYTALLNANYLNAGLVVFVQIRLHRAAQDVFEAFKAAAIGLSEVQERYLVSGNFDYLIKARVLDMDAYRKFLGKTLLTLPGVQESTNYVVMERVKETMSISIPS